jgi:hypothetical protein
MRLSLSHDSGHWFSKLTRVDSSYFLCHFLFVFLILSHPSMSSLLRIGLHNFFKFTFYEVILISWSRPYGWQLNLVYLSFFFLFYLTFFYFILQHYIDWELDFMIWFGLLSMRLSLSHDSSYKFGGLTS